MTRVEGLIEQLYRERYGGFRHALARVGGSRDAARDVVQEAFACALRESRKLRREESLAAWVWRIALRIALRERGGRSHDEVPDDLTIFDAERDPVLAAAIRALPPQHPLSL